MRDRKAMLTAWPRSVNNLPASRGFITPTTLPYLKRLDNILGRLFA